ncbi:glycosyltransferase [Actinoplanes sp. NPDC023714]|uniref:glycosyltransferase n=1 Tax=Actinoplanes sp. NPDC023714 TaxID=3154322 RepID=UPI0033E25382
MRIAHFCDSRAGRPDGVARSAELTVRLLRAAGHEVDLYRPGPLRGPVPSLPLPLRDVRVGLPFTPRRADLVHAHSTGPIGMTGFRAAAAWGVPLVATWHTDLLAYADVYPEIPAGAAWCALRLRLGWSPGDYLELARPGAIRHRRLVELGRAMFARMAVAIAPSPKTAAGFAVFEPRAEIRVLPTPTPTQPSRTERSGNVVLAVGRGTAEKNPELLLEAFARVHATRPGTTLIMLGVRRRRRHLLRRIAALDLQDHVWVRGPVPHDRVIQHYGAAAVLAFASTTDTQGLVLTEAEAAGLPVVVADPALAARPGGDGGSPRFTCDPTPDAFAAGLLRMLDDDALRKRVIDDGLAAAAAYTPEVFLRNLMEIYEGATHGPCQPP